LSDNRLQIKVLSHRLKIAPEDLFRIVWDFIQHNRICHIEERMSDHWYYVATGVIWGDIEHSTIVIQGGLCNPWLRRPKRGVSIVAVKWIKHLLGHTKLQFEEELEIQEIPVLLVLRLRARIGEEVTVHVSIDRDREFMLPYAKALAGYIVEQAEGTAARVEWEDWVEQQLKSVKEGTPEPREAEAPKKLYVPKRRRTLAKWKKAYEVIQEKRAEHKRYDEPEPTDEQLADEIEAVMGWKVTRRHVGEIRKTGDAGLLE